MEDLLSLFIPLSLTPLPSISRYPPFSPLCLFFFQLISLFLPSRAHCIPIIFLFLLLVSSLSFITSMSSHSYFLLFLFSLSCVCVSSLSFTSFLCFECFVFYFSSLSSFFSFFFFFFLSYVSSFVYFFDFIHEKHILLTSPLIPHFLSFLLSHSSFLQLYPSTYLSSLLRPLFTYSSHSRCLPLSTFLSLYLSSLSSTPSLLHPISCVRV